MAWNVLHAILREVRHCTGREKIMHMLQYGIVGGKNEYL